MPEKTSASYPEASLYCNKKWLPLTNETEYCTPVSCEYCWTKSSQRTSKYCVHSEGMAAEHPYDLCIIGAGMFGSAAARHASADPCLKVCLIGPEEPATPSEWAERQIHASHYDEGRIVLSTEESAALQYLGRTSIARFRELERLSGIQFYHPVGTLLIAERKSPHLLNWLNTIRASKTSFVDLSSNDVFSKRFPFLCLEDDDHAFFDDAGAGHISPRGMVEAEKKVARMQGCTLIPDIVEEVRDLEGGLHEVLTDSGRRVRCRRVLLCTGAFSRFKNWLPDLKFSIHRETVALLRVPAEESQRLSRMPPVLKYRDGIADMPHITTGVYVLPPIQYPDKHFYLKIGPMGHHRDSEIRTLEEASHWYASREAGDPETLEKLPRLLLAMIPGLHVEGCVRSKTCVTSDSPSGLPYVDRISATVTVAAVGNGAGALVCEEVGRMASELSVSGRWDSPLPKETFEAVTG